MKCRSIVSVLAVTALFLGSILLASATPIGPTVTYIDNITLADAAAAAVNGSGPGTSQAGGYIFTMNLQSNQQNKRWKAFVGNVTGRLVLQDGGGWSIYDWPLTTSFTGEVYATRKTTTVTWASITCATSDNVTNEEIVMQHTSNPNDNISATFNQSDHAGFDAGTANITASTCNNTNLFVNGSHPGSEDWFEEVVLHDGSNVVYAAIVEDNAPSFNQSTEGRTYDFQMIVPENGSISWTSSTAYYFYVELG